MIHTIKFSHFNLPSSVDRIKITRVTKELNRFLYKGKDIDSMLPLTISKKELSEGVLTYDVKPTYTNLKAIIQEYRNNGWKYKGMVGESAIFVKEGFSELHKPIGDVSRNIIHYTYSTTNSLFFNSRESSVEFFVEGESEKVRIEDHKQVSIGLEFKAKVNLKELFPNAISFRVESTNLKYYEVTPDITLKDYPIDTILSFRFNHLTNDVNRIIGIQANLGYEFVRLYKDVLYFSNGKDERVITLPNGSRGGITFRVSNDGINYSSKISSITLTKEYSDNPNPIEYPDQVGCREIHIHSNNLVKVPLVTGITKTINL